MKLGAALLVLAACHAGSGGDRPDAAIDAAGAGGGACTGSCRTTSLSATFGSVLRTLDHAYYGITTSAASTTIRVEAYKGGGAGCPTMSSPTTDYTLVLSTVPIPTSATTVTSPGNLLDFVGDLLGGQLGARATTVTITPVAADVSMTAIGTFVAFDASLMFSSGMISGHLFATHCVGLDSQQ